MALVVPVSSSTFGDATVTEGVLRKYVLAQLRSDAELGWVAILRAELAVDELKFKHVRERRPSLKKNLALWKQVERGVGQATLVVIDPTPVADVVEKAWVKSGANAGVDFTHATILDGCAAAIVAGTPIAHLPAELATISNWPLRESLDRFTPESIRGEIGPGLRAAQIFAARAHATFDVASIDDTARSTRDTFRSPLARVILTELLSTSRTFDNEHRASADVLNRASDAIADGLRAQMSADSISDAPLVQEHDSRGIDQLQAADVAAGWAREVIDSGGMAALATMFERVWLNGRLIKGPHD